MTRNTGRTLVFPAAAALLFAAALQLVGCGQNQARATREVADEPAVDAPSADELAAREAELEQRAVELEQLEERLAQVARRLERQTETREPDPLPAPEPEPTVPVEPAPQPSEPRIEPEPQPTFRTVTVTVPSMTPVDVEFLDALSSESSLPGDRFLARVVDDVVADGLVAVPAGSTLFGTVEQVRSQKRIGGQARLLLFFDMLELPSGDSWPVEATLQLAGKRQSKKDAATIGGSAAGGAILGRVLSNGDRDKGTVLGAVLGAAVGTAVASNNRGDPVLVDPGLRAEVLLDAPIEVAVRQPVEPEERVAFAD